MSVRSFSWHDILSFYRLRRNILPTNSARALTRGGPIGPTVLLARLNPAVGSYTGIYTSSGGKPGPLIGHMQHTYGDRSARILFLMPEHNLNQPGIERLLEHLAVQAGAWGAFHLLAEIEETNCALEGLRRSGFAVYAWQRIWKFAPNGESGQNGASSSNGGGRENTLLWKPVTPVDEVSVRNLYQSLVPPLAQSAEPLTTRRLPGWVYRQDGEILAYVEGVYGPTGIYLQPLIHPAVENISHVLSSLLLRQPGLLNRPVFLSIRSYQAWLETVLRDLECQVGPRQALMVKHLVLHQRDILPMRHLVLDKYKTEPTIPTAPLVNHSTSSNE